MTMRLAILAVSLIFVGCGSSLEIQQSIGASKYSLAYIHDSKPISEKSNYSVYIDSIEVVKNIGDTLRVRQKGAFVLPLLVLNIWNINYECNFGNNVLEENNISFIKNSFVAEANRSGSFNISSNPSSADYRLKIKIAENNCRGPYNQNGFFYFALYAYGFSVSEKAGPGKSSIKWIFSLQKGNSKIVCDSINLSKIGSPIRQITKNYNQLRKDFGNSLAESLSGTYKECIEKTISSINDKLKQL
jgi:hypothetical protein